VIVAKEEGNLRNTIQIGHQRGTVIKIPKKLQSWFLRPQRPFRHLQKLFEADWMETAREGNSSWRENIDGFNN
jgi:hypothetical protein